MGDTDITFAVIVREVGKTLGSEFAAKIFITLGIGGACLVTALVVCVCPGWAITEALHVQSENSSSSARTISSPSAPEIAPETPPNDQTRTLRTADVEMGNRGRYSVSRSGSLTELLSTISGG